jgi:hypothetical protein
MAPGDLAISGPRTHHRNSKQQPTLSAFDFRLSTLFSGFADLAVGIYLILPFIVWNVKLILKLFSFLECLIIGELCRQKF